ncbi:Rz1-like lysis system protein LysC [uncultured Pseudomonas sp.]|uniref:Rz1-like lysis system protein LysC n=1 Tax=uncultured Pseudomonas sp. TaxID=114707 RepID=UPI0025E8866E|nr:Rz1-like lysis system protein LysC [uncultured Pseudomonas sp.]
MKTPTSRLGLASLCLLLLAGCASGPSSPAPPLTVIGCPVVTRCQLPSTDPRSNGDLLAENEALEAAWADCAAQVDMIYDALQAHP